MFNYLFPNKSKDSESAQMAKKRLLQVVVSQDSQHQVDFHALQQDLLKVLLQYYQHIDLDQVKVELTREEGYSILGLDVTLPDPP
mgnify:CR=1 FL=1